MIWKVRHFKTCEFETSASAYDDSARWILSSFLSLWRYQSYQKKKCTMWGKIGTYEFVTYKFVIHTALSLDIQYGGQIEDYFLLLLVLPWNITLTIMLSNRLNYENSCLPEQRIGNNHRNSSEVIYRWSSN